MTMIKEIQFAVEECKVKARLGQAGQFFKTFRTSASTLHFWLPKSPVYSTLHHWGLWLSGVSDWVNGVCADFSVVRELQVG